MNDVFNSYKQIIICRFHHLDLTDIKQNGIYRKFLFLSMDKNGEFRRSNS